MKPLLTILFLFVNLWCTAQIHISHAQSSKAKRWKLETRNLELLKNTTTLFVYRDTDKPYLKTLKKTLSESWTYTPLEFVSYEEYMENSYGQEYSFWSIAYTHHTYVSETGMRSHFSHFFLSLWKEKGEERNKIKYARIELHPERTPYFLCVEYNGNDEKKDTVMQNLYQECDIRNWHIGYLKNSLQYVEKKLRAEEERNLWDDETSSQLSNLRRSTLYIADDCLIIYDPLGGNEQARHDRTKLLSRYPYKYQFISKEELGILIAESEKPIYYLTYVKSSAKKFVNVFNSKTGDLLYTDHTTVAYNLKEKDIAKLAKAIKK